MEGVGEDPVWEGWCERGGIFRGKSSVICCHRENRLKERMMRGECTQVCSVEFGVRCGLHV